MDDFVLTVNKRLKEAALGDKESVRLLYETVGGHLYYVAFRYLEDEEKAKDVTSEFWSDIYEIAAKFTLSFNGYAYLKRIMVNRSLDYIRKHKREVPLTDGIIEAYERANPVDDGFEGQELNEAVRRGLATLSPTEKKIVYMVFWENATIREIAKTLNTSKSAADRAKQAAIKKLKDYLTAEGWDND